MLCNLLLAGAIYAPSAHACAGLVTSGGGVLATSDAQQGILEQTSTGSVVEYANDYTGTAEDFGWIIVVPTPFTSMSDGDLSRFQWLTSLSQPQVEWSSTGGEDDGSQCGCRSDSGSKGATVDAVFDTGSNNLDVVAEGFTGTYAYTVVESDDAAGLVSWLDDNGWALGDNEAVLTEYVEEGGYAFVLVSIDPDVPLGSGESGMLPPVRIETGSSELRFPARMARDAAPSSQSTRIFVLGDQQAELSGGWSAVDLAVIDAEDGNPEDAFEQAVWEATSDSPTYAMIFSGETSEGWLTRFETRAEREAHETDVEFELTGGRTPAETIVRSMTRSAGASGAPGVIGAGLLLFLWPLLRSRLS